MHKSDLCWKTEDVECWSSCLNLREKWCAQEMNSLSFMPIIFFHCSASSDLPFNFFLSSIWQHSSFSKIFLSIEYEFRMRNKNLEVEIHLSMSLIILSNMKWIKFVAKLRCLCVSLSLKYNSSGYYL